MKDPAAWSPRGLTDLERRLLDAARADRIPPQLSARIAGALDAGCLSSQPSAADRVLQPSTAGAGALPLQTLLFSKAKLWGSLSLALLACAGGWFALRSHGDALERQRAAPPTNASSIVARTPDPAAALPDATHTHDAHPRGPSDVTASPSLDHSAAELAPRDVAAPVVAKPRLADGPSLQEELLLLDHARSALRAGEAQRALSLLDSHARRFMPGALGPEAEVMRVEALVATGANARADLLGRRFLQSHPTHPLAEHVAKLIARP